MADAVTSRTVHDGPRNVVMHFTNNSDGTGESAVVKVDVSALNPAATAVAVKKIDYSVYGMDLSLLWSSSGGTNVQFLQLGDGTGCFDFSKTGGLISNVATSATGDILFTTSGRADGVYSVTLEMVKRGSLDNSL